MSIFDNHFHLRPSALGVEAAKQFERAGGTALMLTHSPYDDVPIRRAEDYEVAYDRTLSMARNVRAATQVKVFVALGPYPVDLLPLRAAVGLAEAVRILKRGIDLAIRRIAAGEAVALGEVGRPHFSVDEEVRDASNDILIHALEAATDCGCAVVLHTEDPTRETFAEFARLADRVRLPRERVVKHHSTPLTRREDNHGIVPSILAKEDLFREALTGGSRFFLETDYIDDPRRPGAVLGPATVPRKTRLWMQRGVMSEAQANEIHKELPERTYGIKIE